MDINRSIKFYAKSTIDKQEIIFSGFSLSDFIKCSPISLKNIMLLKSEYIGAKSLYNFELLEGEDDISDLAHNDICKYGDLCFIDYSDTSAINCLSKEQIAELLYLAHLHEPIKSPFNETLNNNYVYLSHDNGWYCKLFCKERMGPVTILVNKINLEIQRLKKNNCHLLHISSDSIDEIEKFLEIGLLVEISMHSNKELPIEVKLYQVGEYNNMDKLLNDTTIDDSQIVSKIIIN